MMSHLDTWHRRSAGLATVMWIMVVGLGLFLFLKYEMAAGSSGTASVTWPTPSQIRRDPLHPQLVMFAHPRCPCTRASLRELAQVMAHGQGLVVAHVVFLKPPGGGAEWDKTDLWQMASEIPGVKVLADEDGRERKRFGVETSGHVLLYSAAGKLIFSGGITPSRGESGDNSGRSAVVELLLQGKAEQTKTLVFGCPLCKH